MSGRLCKAASPLHKTSGSTYNSAYKKLQRQVEVHLQSVQEAQRELTIACTRQRCLLDLVLHQELVLQLLQQQLVALLRRSKVDDTQCASALNLSNKEAATDLQHKIQQQCSQQQQTRPFQACPDDQAACGQQLLDTLQHQNQRQAVTPDLVVPTSYTSELLQSLTHEELKEVMGMSTADWCRHFYQLFMQLVVLLELINRCDDLDAMQQLDSGTPPPPAAAAAVQAANIAAGLPSIVPQPAHLAAGAPTCYGPSASLRALEQLVDRSAKLVVAAYLYNHLPLLNACMCNYVTQTQSTPPPCHWHHVAGKLMLTEQQVLHFCIGREEYSRLTQAASVQGCALVSTTATPCLFVAAAAEIDSRNASSSDGSKGEAAARQQAAAAAGELQGHCSSSSRSQAAACCKKKTRTGAWGNRRSRGSHQPATPLPAAGAAAAAGQAGEPARGPASQLAAGSTQAATDADAAADGPADPQFATSNLDDQLRHHVHSRHLQLRMIAMFYINTLSRVQLAQMIVSAFPFFPSLTGIANAVAEQQAQLRQQQQQQQPLLGATWQQQQQQQREDQGIKKDRDRFLACVERHVQQRTSLLEQQHLQWWEEVAQQSSQIN